MGGQQDDDLISANNPLIRCSCLRHATRSKPSHIFCRVLEQCLRISKFESWNQVRTLVPPLDSEPGDVVLLDGGSATDVPTKQMKSDDWKQFVECLAVQVRRILVWDDWVEYVQFDSFVEEKVIIVAAEATWNNLIRCIAFLNNLMDYFWSPALDAVLQR
jgi:hypothetical protein